MFKDLDDEIVDKALVLHGKQLFIDNYVIESLTNAKKVLNQPLKHFKNPLVRRDQPWEANLSSPLVMAPSSATSAMGCTRSGIKSGTTKRTPSGRWLHHVTRWN